MVTKIPRFAFEKFPGAEPTLTTSMKSVGEAMAIGRNFQESLQKALRSLETGLTGLDEIAIEGLGQGDDKNAIRAALGTPTPDRLLKVAQAMRLGVGDEQIHASCRIDPWFLAQIRGIVDMEEKVRRHGLPATAGAFRRLKSMGFSDARLGKLSGANADEVAAEYKLSIWCIGDGINVARVARQLADERAVGDVPEAHAAVVASAGEERAIWTDIQCADPAFVGFDRADGRGRIADRVPPG